MTAVPRTAAAPACPEAAADPRRARDGTLVPLVRLLARQAAREFLLTHPPCNDNQPGPEILPGGDPT